MRLHAINTGILTVKQNYYAAQGRLRALRLTSSLIDSDWRNIPVYAWAIEHPEGLIVIDTGESARVNDPDYFPAWQRPYWRTQYRFEVRPEDEIGPQLRQRGLDPNDVRWLVLTHTHFDHTDALYHFPNAEVIISRQEHELTQRLGWLHFAFPEKWPRSLRWRPIEYSDAAVGSFPASYTLTQTGDVQIVPTPGHSPGHQSVVLHGGEGVTYFFGGDTSFDVTSLLDGTLDAPAANSHLTYETRRRIIDYADQTPLVYLTTHDFATERRLQERIPINTGVARQTVPPGF